MASSTRSKIPSHSSPNGFEPTNGEGWPATGPAMMARDGLVPPASAEDRASWAELADRLDGRRNRPFVDELIATDGSALWWLLPDKLIDKQTVRLITKLGSPQAFKKPRNRRRWTAITANWLDASGTTSPAVAQACECLAWAHALPRLAGCLDENLWWKLLNQLVNIGREACQSTAECDPLLRQLLGGELPLTLAYALPELSVSQELAPAARATIVAGLDELLDADGAPRRPFTAAFPGLVASWTRSRTLARNMGGEAWPEPTRRRYERALLNLARLGKIDAGLCRVSRKLDLAKPTRRLLRLLSDGKMLRMDRRRSKSLPPAAMHSEEARLAVLRPTWDAGTPRLSVAYSGRTVQLELHQSGEPLLSGEWQLTVSLNGAPCEIATEWENVCWYSDKDVDFLEVEASLGNGARAQRQILLAREDEVLLLADAVLLSDSARIEYRSSLPLCGPVHFLAAEATREGRLVGRKARALVLPLALPEWQGDHRRGTLQCAGDRLSLTQTHEGRAAYAPLLIDLHAKRTKRECTWRQLTVAEWRAPQPDDVAVGFRGQVGDCNWLVYRALAGDGLRSLLGQQVKAEFLFGRMKAGGGCARLLEIEPIAE